MSLFDLVLTRGIGDPFTKLSLERIQRQKEQFAKPETSIGLTLIPLAIIAFLVLKK